MFLLPLFFSATLHAADAELQVRIGKESHTYKASELLKFPQIKKYTVEHDSAYNGAKMTYDVLPLKALISDTGTDEDSMVTFHALDGFSAPIPEKKLLNENPKKAIAYLAIEPPEKPWPLLRPLHPETAGPFRLIWDHPEKSDISIEEWPYQIASMDVRPSLEKQYPELAPPASMTNERRGFSAFMKTCFACHTLNGKGEAEVGPDLNIPHNPTEYYGKYFETYVRDPQSLRKWPRGRMPPITREILSDADLHAVTAYLKYMTAHKH